MQINSLSPSKLKQSRLCDARLMAKLEDSEYSETTGELAKIGTLAHAAAMLWYRPNSLYLDAMHQGKAQLAEAVRQLPPDRQLLAYINGITQVKQQISAQGIRKYILPGMLGGESDAAFQARLMNDTFKQAMDDVDKRDLPDEAASIEDAKELFGIIASQYPRDQIEVVFAERRYKGALGGKVGAGVPIHCIIDLGIDRGNGVMEIVDYKTGYVTMSTEEMYSEDQVLLNLRAVSQDPAFAEFRTFRFTYFWVRTRLETGPVEIQQDRLDDYQYWLSIKYQYLLDLKEPTETINQYCTSCGRRMECKSYLALVSEMMTLTKVLTPAEAAALTIEQVMAQYGRYKSQEKLIENSRKLLGKILMGELDRQGAKSIEGTKFKVTKQQKAGITHSPEAVIEICREKGLNPARLMSVSAASLLEVFKTDPIALDRFFKAAKAAPQSPYVLVKEISAKKALKGAKPGNVEKAQNRVEPRVLSPADAEPDGEPTAAGIPPVPTAPPAPLPPMPQPPSQPMLSGPPDQVDL